MCVAIYEAATWYDIENNEMHLKKDGDHYVADAMLFRENANLRQENESLKKENDSLRKERDHWHVEQVHAYGNWEDMYKRASELEELASGLHQCLDDEGCEGCPMQDDDGWCIRDIRLRELGVVE